MLIVNLMRIKWASRASFIFIEINVVNIIMADGNRMVIIEGWAGIAQSV